MLKQKFQLSWWVLSIGLNGSAKPTSTFYIGLLLVLGIISLKQAQIPVLGVSSSIVVSIGVL